MRKLQLLLFASATVASVVPAAAQSPQPAASAPTAQVYPSNPPAIWGAPSSGYTPFFPPTISEQAPEYASSLGTPEPVRSDSFIVELTSDMPELGYEVYPQGFAPGKSRPLVTCPTSCRIRLRSGSYEFRVLETDSTLAGSRPVNIARDTKITFDPDTKIKRTGGLILGIGGPIALAVGIALLIDTTGFGEDHPSNPDKTKQALGAFLLIGGLAVTPIGWVMFGTSKRPEYELSTPSTFVSRSPSPSWSFGAVPTNGGISFGGKVTF